MKNKEATLLIISHTGHFTDVNGRPSGWIPTIREVDFLAEKFERIIHLAVLQKGAVPNSCMPYSSENVDFLAIPPFGGPGIFGKISVLRSMFLVLWKLFWLLPKIDVFQFRAPTSIGLVVIPFLTFFSRKKGWYKYAGNWEQPNMPFSYRLQKKMLERWQKRPVTINGRWKGQPKHVYSFANPCLSESELPEFKKQSENRIFQKPYTACFVGRLEDAKGVHRIVECLLLPGIEQIISSFHFIGSGNNLKGYKHQLAESSVEVCFHGFCSRTDTFAIYAKSHLLFLPSDSEGFPKVVAESVAFGCIPIVSDVSSIGQYINESNGYLWAINRQSFADFVLKCNLEENHLKLKSIKGFELAQKFTFEAYWKQLDEQILIVH